jgi:hypothetical protein
MVREQAVEKFSPVDSIKLLNDAIAPGTKGFETAADALSGMNKTLASAIGTNPSQVRANVGLAADVVNIGAGIVNIGEQALKTALSNTLGPLANPSGYEFKPGIPLLEKAIGYQAPSKRSSIEPDVPKEQFDAWAKGLWVPGQPWSPTPHAAGGIVGRDHIAKVHEGELISSPASTKALLAKVGDGKGRTGGLHIGTVEVNVTVEGGQHDEESIAQHVARQVPMALHNFLEQERINETGGL